MNLLNLSVTMPSLYKRPLPSDPLDRPEHSEESVEHGKDDRVDIVETGLENGQDWPVSPWAGFLERYKEGTAHLAVRIDGAELDGVVESYELSILCYSRLADDFDDAACLWVGKAHFEVLHLAFGQSELSVLVEAREEVQHGERMVSRSMRPLIRLNRVEGVENRVPFEAGPDVYGVKRLTFSIDSALSDREVGGVVGRRILGNDQLPGDVVEAGPEILYAVADNKGEVGRGRLVDTESESPQARLRVVFKDSGVGLWFEIIPDSGVEVFQVVQRPVYLGPSTI